MTQEMERDAQQVPIVLTGYVYANDAPAFCRDEADFWIETVGWSRKVRVRAADGTAHSKLTAAQGEGEAAVVSGWLRRGRAPGSDLLEVYQVDPVSSFVRRQTEAA